jgi:hypothetical protein
MPRKTLRMLLMAIVAVLALGSFAEAAAAKKVVRHRTKHSTRVSSAQRGQTQAKKGVARRHKNKKSKKKITAAKKTNVKAKKKPTTKPR